MRIQPDEDAPLPEGFGEQFDDAQEQTSAGAFDDGRLETTEEDAAAGEVARAHVPFVQPVEQKGGLDWFQMCEAEETPEPEPSSSSPPAPASGGKDGVPALEEDGALHMCA